MKKNRKMLGNLLLLLTAMIWGTAFVGQRVGMDSIEPVTFNAARMWLAAAAIGLVAVLTGKKSDSQDKKPVSGLTDTRDKAQERRKNTIIGGICCGSFLTAASLFQQMGVVYTTAGKAGFITAMYMLLVPIINFVFFKKKNTSWGIPYGFLRSSLQRPQ